MIGRIEIKKGLRKTGKVEKENKGGGKVGKKG